MTEYYVPLLKVTFCMHHQIKKKKKCGFTKVAYCIGAFSTKMKKKILVTEDTFSLVCLTLYTFKAM
jgi:hypothetical protein